MDFIITPLLDFFAQIGEVFNYILSIFQTVRYSINTYLTGLYDIVIQIFSSGIF